MKIILTNVKQGKAKKTGKPYALISGFSEAGKCIKDKFVEPEMLTPDISSRCLTKDDLKTLFSSYEKIEVSFDEEGYLESMSSFDPE